LVFWAFGFLAQILYTQRGFSFFEERTSLVIAFDFLDTMAWDVAISAILLATAALMLPSDSKANVPDNTRGTRKGFAVAGFAAGLYLFVSGAVISFMWPFPIANGVYNVLFGGVASLGGLVLLAGSTVLYLNGNLKPITYFAAAVGIYAIIDAYSIIAYNLTSEPVVSALAYLSFAAPAIISVPVAHFGGKRGRVIFAAFAFLFAVAWLLEASSFTIAHLTPT
jgi:uncharacterized membrane protein